MAKNKKNLEMAKKTGHLTMIEGSSNKKPDKRNYIIATEFRPAVFPADIMDDENLSATERWTLVVLCSFVNSNTNNAFPSYQTIAKKAGYDRSTAIRTINKLVEKGYICKEKRYLDKNGEPENTSNIYSLYYKKEEVGGEKMLPPKIPKQQPSGNLPPPLVAICHPNYKLLQSTIKSGIDEYLHAS